MCGIIGITAKNVEVADNLYLALWSLQHRGQESAGIVTHDGDQFYDVRGMGTVDRVFGDKVLDHLCGKAGIGHVRYSTAGGSSIENTQPIEGDFRGKQFWVAHNGNFVRFEGIREEMARKGYAFRTTSDTEVLVALIHYSEETEFENSLRSALSKMSGTYSLVLLYDGKVIGVRDPTGNRPLAIGFGQGVFAISSESATFRVLGFHLLRDVEPGETIVLDGKLGNWYTVERVKGEHRKCLFEYVYFLRPDSVFHGKRAQIVREEMGRNLWRESPAAADCVVAVPDSGKAAALGYAKESGIPLEEALFRSHFVGRTFIEPIADRRTHGLRIKLNPIPDKVRGKRIVLVDDSIVRATVMKKVIADLREAGVAEIHVRVSSPPYCHPCYYGIDTYRVEGELIGKRYQGNVEMIRREIGADSLHYLSIEKLKESVNGDSPLGFCDACFTGNYPIPVK